MRITLWFHNGTQQTVEGNHIKIIHHKPFNKDRVCMTAFIDEREQWNNICLIDCADKMLEDV